MDPTLSAHEQKQVWNGWLSAEMRANYFADLCHRYQRTQKWVTWCALMFASGALATLMGAWLPESAGWVRPSLAALATVFSLWAFVAQNQKGATDCSDLHARWQTLALEFESLWSSGMYSPDAIEKLEGLRKRQIEIGKSGNAFPNKKKLMEYWQDHVQMHHVPHDAAHKATANVSAT